MLCLSPRDPRSRAVLTGALLPLVLAGLAGCDSAPSSTDRPVVMVSVLPQAWFVRQMAGDLVDVVVLIPPGASPATYEPSLEQMKQVSRARLYLTVGHPAFPFERVWKDRIVAQNHSLVVVPGFPGEADLEDPHPWTAPPRAASFVRVAARALADILPESRERIEASRDRLLARVDALDREIAEILKPVAGRRFYVYHPAWQEFAAAYDLEQVAIETGHREPTAGELVRLVDQARADGVRLVFVQPQISRRAADLLAAEIGARVAVADPLAADWESALREFARTLRESWA